MGLICEPLLYAFALVDTGTILFVLVYFVIALSDLECDYLNAQQCCSSLNKWVMPKILAHTFLNFMLLIHADWLLALVNLPMTIWLWYEYCAVPQGNLGIFDPTEIHNRRQLKKHTRDCMIYLGYYLIFFFIYLYCMIIALLRGDPISRGDDDSEDF
ncbi:protein cornichon homolog 4 [Venturia canescens]|uniref:protein cornichon homolog 4 n=1 Tax=Venturia canescens TaxID=32260 RepID=UPI001C9CAEEC|nr:protein cornichon homolog 4 [Venturia canescens]